MPQRDMSWETFTRILSGIGAMQSGHTVSLQGEGEPSLHPLFWQMVDYVYNKGYAPYSILNGSRIDASRIAQKFPHIGLSLDTLDEGTAEQIGRYNLSKVLSNLEELRLLMGPQRITIMSVDMGQPLGPLRAWVRKQGFGRHIIQPLARKDDYAKRYSNIQLVPRRPRVPSTHTLSCDFLERDRMRFYTWQGQELPCCFIKDTTGIESISGLRTALVNGEIPLGCSGCPELRPAKPTTVGRPGPEEQPIGQA